VNLPETRQRVNLLFDFYEALLTPRQREIFAMHHMDDCSLAEIGDAMSITPQAVADMLKRVNGKLNHYDKLLGLVEKFEHQQKTAEEINLALNELVQTESVGRIRKLVENLPM
jgi:hypothetical protein